MDHEIDRAKDQAPQTGEDIEITPFKGYWQQNVVAVRRVARAVETALAAEGTFVAVNNRVRSRLAGPNPGELLGPFSTASIFFVRAAAASFNAD